ncbi:MAG: hypothetical protein DI603_13035 [Roseateles depolymerans]|uniref:Uncharacterized protein n=1 Tax=Roseateles depolymerans TaxID=76731 RepID=A0A2W5DHE3_9BURK|nr:MAG: hypothetical protein DI603_13035 [Roseateles depolymerans]
MRHLFAQSSEGVPQDLVLAALDQRLKEIDELAAGLASQRAETLALREQLLAEWPAGRCMAQKDTGPPAGR